MNERQTDVHDLEDALAWCLTQRDSGNDVTEEAAIKTFPQFADDLRAFFADERRLAGRVASLADQDDATLPDRIAHYELKSKLGVGSFGVVHRAWDTQLHRFVAIKTPRYLIGDNKSRIRFLREARTASQLSHPHIVRTIEIGEFESTPYIVSEIVDGESLREWLSNAVTPRAAAQMTLDLASGLEHAHQRGVIHRDLTPNNILVDSDDRPHILDFGLAKFLQSESTVSISGAVLGTPAYVSPEQVSGDGHNVDGRADIYALGVILYQMLTGKRPFDGSLKLLLHRIQFEEPLDPAQVKPGVPGQLAAICCKCLEKAPANRYETATSLLADLQAFLDADDSAVATPATKSVTPTSSKSWKWVLGVVGLGIVAVASFLQLPKTVRNSQDLSVTQDDDNSLVASSPPITGVLHGHRNTVASADFRTDGQRLATCGHDGLVCVWDWNSRNLVWSNDSHQAEIWSVDWSPDGKRIATASWDQVSKVLDAETGDVLLNLEGHTGKICCVQFSPDGQTLATAALDGTIRFWDPMTGIETNELKIEGAEFVNCQFTPDGMSLIATDWKGRLAKWNLSDNQLVFTKTAHKSAAWTVCYIPHMSAIATGGEDGFIRLWDENTGELLVERKAAKGHVTCVRPHPNGRQLMHASHDKSICIWDAKFENIEKEFLGHEHWIYEFVLHPEGEFFVSTSVDQTVRIWGIDEGRAPSSPGKPSSD